MDQSRFQEAKQAYAAGDYRTAAKTFLASAGKGAAGNGAAYHMAGNSLMRLRRHQDAITVYGHALKDETYDKRGALFANLGSAYSEIGEYAEAIRCYESALVEPDYTGSYRAYQGMAGALCERGRVEEAAAAYRSAALDPGNPDPGKALVNLGLCFMALDRPADAVEAYKAALGFDEFQGRGKALAAMGQAYTTLGDHTNAVKAFEKATQLHGYELSPAAQTAYVISKSATVDDSMVVEGWVTGEMPPVMPASDRGWDTGDLVALGATVDNVQVPPRDHVELTEQAAAALGMGDDEAVNHFFSRTEEEMLESDRAVRANERRRRRQEGAWVKPLIFAVLAVLAVAGGLFAAYWFGFGWPTQDATVTGLMASYAQGEPYDRYWVAVPEEDLTKEMSKVPPVATFQTRSVSAQRDVSVVLLTVTPADGDPLDYKVTLAREGFGWKVSGIENDWSSSGD